MEFSTPKLFLDLPRELRDQIYDLSLKPKTKIPGLRQTNSTYRVPSLSIQLVSHQIREELLSRAAVWLHLEMNNYFDFARPLKSLGYMPKTAATLQHLKVEIQLFVHAHISTDPKHRRPRTANCQVYESFLRQWAICADFCRTMPNLRSVDVVVTLANRDGVGRCLEQIRFLHDRLPRFPSKKVSFVVDVMRTTRNQRSEMVWETILAKRVFVIGDDDRLKRDATIPPFEGEEVVASEEEIVLQNTIWGRQGHLHRFNWQGGFGRPPIENS